MNYSQTTRKRLTKQEIAYDRYSFKILSIQWVVERSSGLELVALSEEMRKIQPSLKQRAKDGYVGEFRRLLFKSNNLICDACGSRTLSELIKHLWLRHTWCVSFSIEHMIKVADYQDELISAIRGRDIVSAVRLLNESMNQNIASVVSEEAFPIQ